MEAKGNKGVWTLLLLGTAASCLSFAIGLFAPEFFLRISEQMYDAQLRSLPATPHSSLPVIIEVDERSIQKLGQWPWSRYQLARLVNQLNQYQPAAVGIDALFSEPDRTSPAEVSKKLSRELGLELPVAQIPKRFQDYDRLFAEALAGGPNILTHYFLFGEQPLKNRTACLPDSASGSLVDRGGGYQSLHRATGIMCSIPALSQAAAATGFNNADPSLDGIYRRIPLVLESQNRIFPSFALQAFLQARKLDQFYLISLPQGGFELKVGNQTIPLDTTGSLAVRFKGPQRTYPYLSAIDVIEGKIKPEQLKNKIALIGFSATSLMEYRPIYLDPLYLGVETHAAIIDNLERGDYFSQHSPMPYFEMVLALGLGILLAALLARSTSVSTLALPVVFALLSWFVPYFLLQQYGTVISPVPFLVTLFLVSTTTIGGRYLLSAMQLRNVLTDVKKAHAAIIQSICAMAEYRDPETGAHIIRTQHYIKVLATYLQQLPDYAQELTPEKIELIFQAAPLHDIGKIGIRDAILLKPDRLTEDEYTVMKTHPELGAQVIQKVVNRLGPTDFLEVAGQLVYGHHEKWDGSGYPQGLQGEQIPVAARLMALADVYDALISRRVYKPGFTHLKACEIIKTGAGKHFDPTMVEAFLTIHLQFLNIAIRNAESDSQREVLQEQARELGVKPA